MSINTLEDSDDTTNTPKEGGALVVTRATYDARLNSGDIDNNTIYFVIEPGAEAKNYLSLYVGESKQTDLINLNETIEELPYPLTENDVPTKNITARDKLYFWQDENSEVAHAYVQSTLNGINGLLPLYSPPIWEEL